MSSVYEYAVSLAANTGVTFTFQTQEAWVKEVILVGVAGETEANPGEYVVAITLASGKRIPAMTGQPNKSVVQQPGISVFPGQRLTVPVNERNPFPHTIRVDAYNDDDDQAHVVQVIAITEEPPMEQLQMKEDEHAEIT